MAKLNWSNRKSHTSIKDETTQRQQDHAAKWLAQNYNKSRNGNSAYLDSDSGIVHASTPRRESKNHRKKREQRLEQQKRLFQAEMQLYEEERRRFDMIQQRNRE
jgi:hypothetical protein